MAFWKISASDLIQPVDQRNCLREDESSKPYRMPKRFFLCLAGRSLQLMDPIIKPIRFSKGSMSYWTALGFNSIYKKVTYFRKGNTES